MKDFVDNLASYLVCTIYGFYMASCRVYSSPCMRKTKFEAAEFEEWVLGVRRARGLFRLMSQDTHAVYIYTRKTKSASEAVESERVLSPQ